MEIMDTGRRHAQHAALVALVGWKTFFAKCLASRIAARGTSIMALVTYAGFPRIGLKRELKRALEAYWRGEIGADALQDTARALRARHWKLGRDAGADIVVWALNQSRSLCARSSLR